MNSSRVLFCSPSPPDTGDHDHWSPGQGGKRHALSTETIARLPGIVELKTETFSNASRAAFRSLVPWFSVWLHRILETAHGLPASAAAWETVSVGELDSLEQEVIAVWAKADDVPWRRAQGSVTSRPRDGEPLLNAIASLRHHSLSPSGDVLIVSLQPNSTRASLPIAHALRTQGLSVSYAVLGLNDASSKLVREAGFRVSLLERLFPPEGLVEFLGALDDFVGFFDSAEFEGLLESLKRPLWLTPRRLSGLVAKLAKRRYLNAWLKALALARLLEEATPSLVLFPSDHALVASVVRSHRVARSALLLQGVVPFFPPLRQSLDVDLALVGSSLDLEYLRSSRIADGAARITGYPDYEHFGKLSRSDARAELNSRFQLSSARPVVAFLSQYATELFPDWARRKNLGTFLESARENPSIQFLIKLHPRREAQLDQTRELPPNVVLVRDELSTPLLIAAADVAVTYWSTTALETLLLGTPLLQLNATGLADYYPLSERYGVPTLRTAEALSVHLRKLCDGSHERERLLVLQRSFLREIAIPPSEEAAANSALALRNLLGDAPSPGGP